MALTPRLYRGPSTQPCRAVGRPPRQYLNRRGRGSRETALGWWLREMVVLGDGESDLRASETPPHQEDRLEGSREPSTARLRGTSEWWSF